MNGVQISIAHCVPGLFGEVWLDTRFVRSTYQ